MSSSSTRNNWDILVRRALNFVLFTCCFSHLPAQVESPKVVFFGHSYHTLRNSNDLDYFIERINQEAPNAVAILGDADCWNQEIYSKFNTQFKSQLYYSPGNHDLIEKAKREKYFENAGYLNTYFSIDQLGFVLLNSNAEIGEIESFLQSAKSELMGVGKIVLLTHHRIWDDNLISPGAYRSDKNFAWEEILPSLENWADIIIAGNGPRQYFGGTDCMDENTHVAYWLDHIDGIECYSIGMGRNATFFVAEIDSNEIIFRSVKVDLPSGNFQQRKSTHKSSGWLLFTNLYKSKRFWFGFGFATVLLLLVRVLTRQKVAS